jgi:hypothetical protein
MLSELVEHMGSTGSGSTTYHGNLDAALSWCNMFPFQLKPDDPLAKPSLWISSMLTEKPTHRPTASNLFDSIKERTIEQRLISKFIGDCCDE